jgi:uncharacterized tellurite resistance protein B-like protein
MKNKEEEERQRKIEAKEQLQAVLKADKIFQELEKEKSLKVTREKLEIQDAHIQQIVSILTSPSFLQINRQQTSFWIPFS